MPATARPKPATSLECSSSRDNSEAHTPNNDTHNDTLPAPPRPKSVRFNDELVSIRFFRETERPCAISNTNTNTSSPEHSDTGTDSDSDSDSDSESENAEPSHLSHLEIKDISPIPSPHTPPNSNVHLESLAALPRLRIPARIPAVAAAAAQRSHPLVLRGIIRVRNISYEKRVAARYTLDDWTTISEALARYVGSGPSHDGEWDRFAFTISLSLELFVVVAAAPRTLLLSVRFTVPDGEWWDNNGGDDFRVVLLAPQVAAAATATKVGIGIGTGTGTGTANSVRRDAFPRNVVVEFPRQPLQVGTRTCSLLAPHVVPVPPAVTSRWLHVA